MNVKNVLLPALTGTSFMTLFSYIVSEYEGRNFSEPELLAVLERHILPEGEKRFALPAGWITHYIVGILFTWLYEYWHKHNNKKPSLKSGILLGGLSGIAGVAMWKIVFSIHPTPPPVYVRKFFNQLLLAHFIFGISVVATKRQLNKMK